MPSLRAQQSDLPRGLLRRFAPRNDSDNGRMTARGLLLVLALALPALLQGCGWEPLYADPQTGPADADLRSVKVAPIPERLGENLARALRQSFNPSNEPAEARYVLRVTPTITQLNLGISTQGVGTLGRTEITGNFQLNDLKTNTPILSGNSHVSASFDLVANGYANVVAMNDSQTRAIEELRRDLVTRLTVFFQRRAAETPPKPPKT